MEKIVGRTLYNTNRDTRIVGHGLNFLFTTSLEDYYQYLTEGKIIPLEHDGMVDWLRLNWGKFSVIDIERVKRYIKLDN